MSITPTFYAHLVAIGYNIIRRHVLRFCRTNGITSVTEHIMKAADFKLKLCWQCVFDDLDSYVIFCLTSLKYFLIVL